jgi:hypothetical protein
MHPVFRNGLLMVVLALSALSQGVAAKDISIRIDRLAGTVEVNHGGKWVAAERFQDIGPGWQLRTGKASKAMLVFPFGNICIIKANSLLTVDKLGLEAGSKLKLDSGGLLADLRTALSPGSEFSVETASALAAVRGTEFAVDYREDDAGDPTVWFCCFRGAVELSNAAGPSQPLTAGHFVTVRPGGAVPPPLPSTAKADEFLQEITDLSAFEEAEGARASAPSGVVMGDSRAADANLPSCGDSSSGKDLY